MLIASHSIPTSVTGPNDKIIRARALAALIGRFWSGAN
jgi:hypothetical protein